MDDPIEVCPKCFGTVKPGHVCGPETLAKDDLCPKCLIVEEQAVKALFHYAKDMLQIEKVIRDDEMPLGMRATLVEDILDKRAERILRDIENGENKRG